MFGGMKNKLQAMQQKMEEVKARLDTITVIGEAGGGKIRATANGNRRITQLDIQPIEGMSSDSPEYAEEIKTAINRALEQAERLSESEMQGVAMGMMPNIPGMFK